MWEEGQDLPAGEPTALLRALFRAPFVGAQETVGPYSFQSLSLVPDRHVSFVRMSEEVC